MRKRPGSIRIAALLLALSATLLPQPAPATPPLPAPVATPVLSYDGQGFATYWKGQIVAISRQGTRHWEDPTGRISLYTFSDGYMDWPPTTLVDTQDDDRNAAGGVTPTGALVFFYSRLIERGKWRGIYGVRVKDGQPTTTYAIRTWPDGSYSAYGPLVVLPSGRLMQTFYGWSKTGYRIRAMFSNDDGRTWKEERIIEFTRKSMPNETAAAFVGGTTDANSRLIAMTRSARWINGNWIAFLMQYISTNGGRTWRPVGWVGGSKSRGVVPWIANIGGGRLALITVIRDPENMTINVSIAPASKVFNNSKAWPPPRPIYRSTLAQTQQIRYQGYGQAKNYGDFGYPSIVQAGPRDSDKFVVFYDSHTGYSGWEPYDLPTDTDLIIRPLFAPTIPPP